jgi:hypothetical protein
MGHGGCAPVDADDKDPPVHRGVETINGVE